MTLYMQCRYIIPYTSLQLLLQLSCIFPGDWQQRNTKLWRSFSWNHKQNYKLCNIRIPHFLKHLGKEVEFQQIRIHLRPDIITGPPKIEGLPDPRKDLEEKKKANSFRGDSLDGLILRGKKLNGKNRDGLLQQIWLALKGIQESLEVLTWFNKKNTTFILAS